MSQLSESHPTNGPTILHVMYDSLRAVEKSVAELAAEQSSAAVVAERMRGDIGVIRHSLQGFATLHKDVSDLKNKMWAISLVGGLVAGIATIVLGGMVRDAIDRPRAAEPAQTYIPSRDSPKEPRP